MLRLISVLFLIIMMSVSHARSAAIASAHPLATQAGVDIINAGGNAFDAAVAVTAALAVVEPYSSGIGGGGFWLLHNAATGKDIMLDGREKAPLAAHRDMYLDSKGEVVKNLSVNGALAAGIPGVPAALEHLSKHYGNLSLAENLAPAIKLARYGFTVEAHYQRMAGFRLNALLASPAAAKIFLHNNKVPEEGYLIRQVDLSKTLEKIAKGGAKAFYTGELANKLVAGVRAASGIWHLDDLRQYKVVEREPLVGRYKNMTITSVAPPSSGGVAMIEIFNQLENFPLDQLPKEQQVHLVVEAMRRAYRDRAEYLGDTDFINVPIKRLTNKNYAAGLQATIHPNKATPSELLPGVMKNYPGTDTTHFSIIDRQGNRVAATLSVNYPFGACFVPPGTGVLLNDEMDDFSAKPGVPNVYGLVGAEANAIEPGKRMLSSMSPTFLETDDRLAIIGTPGGSRIITMVLLAAIEFQRGGDAQKIVDLPRYHHQYLPDRIFYESAALSATQAKKLTDMGHSLKENKSSWGNMQIVIKDRKSDKLEAASDYRGLGAAVVIP